MLPEASPDSPGSVEGCEQMSKHIYIAGPMRGIAGYNYEKFNRIAANFRSQGHIVENPVEIGNRFGSPDEINANPEILNKVVEAQFLAIQTCDTIYLLKGWEKSVGAKHELFEALPLGLEIILEERQDA